MQNQDLQLLCDTVSESELMGHLAELARWVKLSGTPEELESLSYVRSRLDEYGYRTTMLMHDAYITLPGRAQVEVDRRNLACIPHSFSRPSAAGGTRHAVDEKNVYGDITAGEILGRRGCHIEQLGR